MKYDKYDSKTYIPFISAIDYYPESDEKGQSFVFNGEEVDDYNPKKFLLFGR